MTNFAKLLQVLSAADVEFIIVGGVAAFAHGASRLTQDLDVVYRRTQDRRSARVENPCHDVADLQMIPELKS